MNVCVYKVITFFIHKFILLIICKFNFGNVLFLNLPSSINQSAYQSHTNWNFNLKMSSAANTNKIGPCVNSKKPEQLALEDEPRRNIFCCTAEVCYFYISSLITFCISKENFHMTPLKIRNKTLAKFFTKFLASSPNYGNQVIDPRRDCNHFVCDRFPWAHGKGNFFHDNRNNHQHFCAFRVVQAPSWILSSISRHDGNSLKVSNKYNKVRFAKWRKW